MFLKFQVWLVGTLLWLSACVYGTMSPINCICYSHWADEEEKSRPLLDPVYHVLYNYHVYWIFIFTVTKEPSAHSSSLQLSSDISCETLGTDQSDPTPPSITRLKADMTYPSRSLKSFYIFIYVFVSNLAPVLEYYSKISAELYFRLQLLFSERFLSKIHSSIAIFTTTTKAVLFQKLVLLFSSIHK